MVEALVVVLVVGSVGTLGTALLVRPRPPVARLDEPALDDGPRVMHDLPPVPPPLPARRPVQPSPPPPRPVRRCGYCRAAGHSRALCPRVTGVQMIPGLKGSSSAPAAARRLS